MCGVNEKALPLELKDDISFLKKFKLVSSRELNDNKGDRDALYISYCYTFTSPF